MDTIATTNLSIQFKRDCRLDVREGVDYVTSPKCGAVNIFIGSVRDTETMESVQSSRRISAIYYDAYESMAFKQVFNLVDQIINHSALSYSDLNSRAYVALRLGTVPTEEASIMICVSSTRRLFSHKATLLILEKIKSIAPIWKKMIFEDGHQEWACETKSEAGWLTNLNLE